MTETAIPEQFDPRRLRVFAVDATRRWRTYVVAESVEQAVDFARECDEWDPDAGDGDATTAYEASELRELSSEDDPELAWGPRGWGRRQLWAHEALELIAHPQEPPPPMPNTDELRHLDDWDWVRLAAGENLRRPALRGVLITDGTAVATDGVRLHLAPASREDGLWDSETGEQLPELRSSYPDYRHMISTASPNLELVDLPGAWRALHAGPAEASLPGPDGDVVANARLLAEALLGGARAERIHLTLGSQFQPIRIDFPDLERTALVMPIRAVGNACDLSAFVRPLTEVRVR